MKQRGSVRCMEPGEAARVAALEAEIFSDAWSLTSLEEVAESRCDRAFVMELGGEICAYCLVRQVLDEGEILRIGVALARRRQGLAEELLCHIFEIMPEVTVWNLEVRAGNAAAIALYKKLGFQKVGLRRCYYREPLEDAVLMARKTEIENLSAAGESVYV